MQRDDGGIDHGVPSPSRGGRPPSAETRAKISASLRGKTFSEAHRAHLSESAQKRPSRQHTEETRDTLRKAATGRRLSFETKRKLSEIKKGKPGHPQTVEAREKISDAKRNQTAETREKIRQSLLGRRRKFETIVKVVEARKGRKLTLQERAELKERVTKRRAKERAGAIDTMLWEYAVKHGLLSCVVQTYRITAEEILLLRSYYQHPGTERRPADDLLDRFSVALANVA